MAYLPYVDLHIHSYYSDGSMSPGEIVEAALKNQVGILAISDHDVLEGSRELMDLCTRNEITAVPGVELDALEGDRNIHVLAYGFDLENREFIRFTRHLRQLLEELSVSLIRNMQQDVPTVSLAEFEKFQHNRRLGGWKALQYLMAKGLTSSLKEGISFYPRYGISYGKSGYPSVSEVCRQIKKAGGTAILAHPGVVIQSSDIQAFSEELERILSWGLEGAECFYPTHSEAVTNCCLEVCRRKNLLITAGSDCHGVFGNAQVGQMRINHDQVVLDGIC